MDTLFSEEQMQPLTAPEWERHGHDKFVFLRHRTGYQIHHCGHPTANWPYFVLSPQSFMHLAANGRGFSTIDEAKAFVLERIAAL